MKESPEAKPNLPSVDIVKRRRSERVNFPTMAHLVDSNGLQHQMRVSDLGKGGCYVDSINPAPVGTPIYIQIRHANKTFEAQSTVRYSLPHMGMGLQFTEMTPSHEATLEEWLGIRQTQPQPEPDQQIEKTAPGIMDEGHRDVTKHLIVLLTHERVISEGDADELLRRLGEKK